MTKKNIIDKIKLYIMLLRIILAKWIFKAGMYSSNLVFRNKINSKNSDEKEI